MQRVDKQIGTQTNVHHVERIEGTGYDTVGRRRKRFARGVRVLFVMALIVKGWRPYNGEGGGGGYSVAHGYRGQLWYPSSRVHIGADSPYTLHNRVHLPEREVAKPHKNCRRRAPLQVVLLRPIVEEKVAQESNHTL